MKRHATTATLKSVSGTKILTTIQMSAVSAASPACVANRGPGDGLGLLDAIIDGNAARVEALLRECHSPSAILYAASARGNLDMVQLLLEAGADKDGDDGSVQPPLQAACRWGKLEVAQFLVKVGADKDRLAVTFTAIYGSTPLMEASRRGHLHILRFLIQARADKERRNTRGETALHWASSAGRSEAVSLLVEARADVHQTTAAGSTPLLEAWRLGHLDAACRLRCAGADLGEVPLFQEMTPFLRRRLRRAIRKWHLKG